MNNKIKDEDYIFQGEFNVDYFREVWESSYPPYDGFSDEEIRLSREDSKEGEEVRKLIEEALEIELLDDMSLVKNRLRKNKKLI